MPVSEFIHPNGRTQEEMCSNIHSEKEMCLKIHSNSDTLPWFENTA